MEEHKQPANINSVEEKTENKTAIHIFARQLFFISRQRQNVSKKTPEKASTFHHFFINYKTL